MCFHCWLVFVLFPQHFRIYNNRIYNNR
jgi:hypothetical protein